MGKKKLFYVKSIKDLKDSLPKSTIFENNLATYIVNMFI